MKPKMLIVSDTIRADLHAPLRYFRHFRVIHCYRQATYGDMTGKDFAAATAVQFNTLRDLKVIITRYRPAIVQLPEPMAGRRAALTDLALIGTARKTGAKIIVPFFENTPLKEKFGWVTHRLIAFVARKVLREADLLIYLNKGARSNLMALGAPKRKLAKLFWGSWGTDERFRPSSKLKAQSLKQNIVLYVGVISKRKGIAYLIEAMERVLREVPDAKLWLVGPAGDFRVPRKPWIRVFGSVKNRQLPKFFQESAVACLASITTAAWREQVGMVNLQALATGTPIVTTRSGAISEFVKEGEGAVLVPERDSAALGRAIKELLLLPASARVAFGRKGQAWVSARYQIRPNIVKIERLLGRLLRSRQT